MPELPPRLRVGGCCVADPILGEDRRQPLSLATSREIAKKSCEPEPSTGVASSVSMVPSDQRAQATSAPRTFLMRASRSPRSASDRQLRIAISRRRSAGEKVDATSVSAVADDGRHLRRLQRFHLGSGSGSAADPARVQAVDPWQSAPPSSWPDHTGRSASRVL